MNIDDRIEVFEKRVQGKQAKRDRVMARVDGTLDKLDRLRGMKPERVKAAILRIRRQDARDFPLIRKLDEDLLALKYRLSELKAKKELRDEGIHVGQG